MTSPSVYHRLAREHRDLKISVLMYIKIINQIDLKS